MARRRNINRQLTKDRERKYHLRGKRQRFIPARDSDFAQMGRTFASHVEKHAERLGVAAEKVGALISAVAAFRDALCQAIHSTTAGPSATRRKNEARKDAEKIVRSVARYLRGIAEESLDGVDRMILNVPERPKRVKRLTCPQVPPVLKFIGSTDPYGRSAQGGRHILEYGNDFDRASSAKPHGAARLELFVELVPVGEPIPAHPGQRSGGRHWYLRSFTMSRFEVDYPVVDDGTPMLVVYWGRWADGSSGVGPFSQTCVARVESGAGRAALSLPGEQREQLRVTQWCEQIEAKFMVIEQRPVASLPPAMADVVEEAEVMPRRKLLEAL